MKKELFDKFFKLLMELEPENLYMDGEATEQQVISREKALRYKWKFLEKYAGKEVTEQDIWDMHLQKLHKKVYENKEIT